MPGWPATPLEPAAGGADRAVLPYQEVFPYRAVHYQAVSVHAPLQERSWTGAVYAVWHRAVTILTRDRDLVAVLTRGRANAPGAAVVSAPPGAFQAIPEGDPVVSDGDRILFASGTVVDLRGARIFRGSVDFEPAPGARPLLLSAIGEELARRREARSVNSLSERIRDEAMSRFRQAADLAAGGRPGESVSGFGAVVGLGPGSTPSGDDMIAGGLCALAAACAPAGVPLRAALREAVLRWSGATGEISRSCLRWAAAGEFSEEALEMLASCTHPGTVKVHPSGEAVDGPVVEAVGRVARTGASSGADFLFGFLEAAKRGW